MFCKFCVRSDLFAIRSRAVSQVDTRHGEILRTIDPVVLGSRVRAARVARGWRQSELAEGLLSVAYLSRIETGARRPTFNVLVAIAERLGLTAEEMLYGASADDLAEINLGLSYAELALENGEPLDAEHQARQYLNRAHDASLSDLAERGRFLVARAMEAQGQLDEAITEYESVLEQATGVAAIRCGIALVRCYRNAGDVGLAIELGDRLQPRVVAEGLEQTDEAVQLAMTVASAYGQRGDLSRAARICTEAIKVAERAASPVARSSAYWNASVISSERGDTQSAVALASRALALLGEGEDTRNLARLRLHLGRMQLELEGDDLSETLAQIKRGSEELKGTSASRWEVLQGELVLARALLVDGRPTEALAIAVEARGADSAEASFEDAEACIIEGEANEALGRRDEAVAAYHRAAETLTSLGEADRWIAQAWYELAELFDGVGEFKASHAALRAAATASGLKMRRRAGAASPVTTSA
ncbi:transcriptional regulator with XRE-family HTH domain [Nocardioides thalensis]|uniref:Transcriptional regulator with XRE-family HTH domain n=1 Tax=Nocardioides thalensis TaxID=1914755 RepID=A0A853C574_9ACTN|nr:helix-turn-helix transcriptional regulator [Nocardioides thalensis]NYJ01413.1 transcriptional regulator with XRE-family HTH domain [Nocardioides thalensis]